LMICHAIFKLEILLSSVASSSSSSYHTTIFSSHLISSSCYWYLQWQKLLHNFSSWS
jgi:hypothetical protein